MADKKRVIHPWAGKATNQKQENILVHHGSKPSHFDGCIGVGFLEKAGSALKLRYHSEALEVIWQQAGGKPGVTEFWNAASPRISFRVAHAFPARGSLKPHLG